MLDQKTLKRILRTGLFLIPALIYLPAFGGNLAMPPGEDVYSDLMITHYPNLLFLRETIITQHQIPLWSTLIQSGAPFAANPLSGLFYLPGWIAMVFPLPAGLSITMAAHVVFGTWGMYRFLKLKGISEEGSILGAMGFGMMPKLAAHFGAGHVTLIYAISWTPWLLYCSKKDNTGWRTGIVAGLLFLADPRWSIYAGLLWLSYDIAHRQIDQWHQALFYLKASLIAILISAPLLIPLLEYIQFATRSRLSAGDILTGSLPVSNLIGAIMPGSGGNTEWYFYSGGILLGVFIAQLIFKDLRKTNRFWMIWLLISTLFSLGYWGIDVNWISKIPVLNLLRVPARSLFITGLCFAVIAGKSVDQIRENADNPSSQRKTYFIILVLGLFLLIGVGLITQAKHLMALWGFLFLGLCGLTLFVNQKKSFPHFGWIIVGLLVVDLLGAGWCAYVVQRKDDRDPGDIHTYIIEDDEIFRVYSPSYSVPQHLAAEYGLELADGVDPMQIRSYVEFFASATGIPQDIYSVTIPPFETGNPHLDNRDSVPDARLLGLLNVKYLLSEFEVKAPGIVPLATDGKAQIYLNDNFLPRAWVELESVPAEGLKEGDLSQAKIVHKTPNSIQLEADGPGTLVISEVHYPGWRVFVDGKREEITSSYTILRSVLLDEGTHEIEFVFRPLSVYAGLTLAVLGWIFIAYIRIRERVEKIPG